MDVLRAEQPAAWSPARDLAVTALLDVIKPVAEHAEDYSREWPPSYKVTIVGADGMFPSQHRIATASDFEVAMPAEMLRALTLGGPYNVIEGSLYGRPITFRLRWETSPERLLAAIDDADAVLHAHYHGGEAELVEQLEGALQAIRDAA